jgi:restriction system-associated AAA family ATPase
MKLHRLKILSEFRGLSPNFRIPFKGSGNNSKLNIEPICFVGLNGSGKSNVLEALCEIFYYLETYHLADRKNLSKFKTKFGFEIEYSLPKFTFDMARTPWEELNLTWEELDQIPIFKIIKKPNKYPIISALFDDKEIFVKNSDNNRNIGVLPARIIGYSSGMNELISNPFIKIDFHYFDNFKKKSGESLESTLDINRMFFMDYDSNQLITLCNLLFDHRGFDSKEFNSNDFGTNNLDLLKDKLDVKGLHSFSIVLKLRDNNNRPLKIPSELNIAIDKLIKCATCFEEKYNNTNEGEIRNLILYFWVNNATKEAFRYHFKTAYDLYRNLYFLRLLNIYRFNASLIKKVINAKIGLNISSLLPKHEEDKQVFVVKDIAFKKNSVMKPVYYRQLSDGEHQLLHVLGTIILMDTPGSLFILDEPETHFNPEWRSQFVSFLNNCLGNSTRNQDILLTSHSPFIVSDCKPEKVYSFYRNSTNKIEYKQPNFNTYGASINLISMKVFHKKETISGLAQSQIEEIKNQFDNKKIDGEMAINELNKLGDSVEKMILIDYLNKSKKNNAI